MDQVNKTSTNGHTAIQKKNQVDCQENLSVSELKELLLKLKEKCSNIDNEIADLESKGVTTDLRPQMQALHDYNDIKDLTQTVLGFLSDLNNCTIVELHQKFNLPLD